MLLEGKNAVAEALSAESTIEKILISKSSGDNDFISQIKASGVQFQFVDKAVLDRHSKTGKHQGFIAFTTDYQYHDLAELIESAYKKGSQPMFLALDGVQDPHNLGNIIRTAECMGVDGIIIPKNRCVSVTETVVRVSAGATAHIPVSKVTNLNQEVEILKKKGFWIYAMEAGGVNISKTNLTGPICVIMGGEDSGVRQLTKSLVDNIISIPMHGKINSLNVANATAMVLYEINRQRFCK